MIVRIATESQYRMLDEHATRLRELDDETLAAIEAEDEPHFHEVFDELVNFVREHGEHLDEEDLLESDVIVPPPDISFEEAKHEFSGEGIIPEA